MMLLFSSQVAVPHQCIGVDCHQQFDLVFFSIALHLMAINMDLSKT